MSVKMSKTREILFILTVFLSNLIIMGESYVFSPTINNLYGRFPDELAFVNFIVSGYAVVKIFISPVVGKLNRYFSSKRLMIFGAACSLLGGAFMILFENPLWMSSMRILFAVGYSFTQVCLFTLLAQVYTDKNKNGTIVGFYSAAGTAIGMVISLAAGYLASISINSAYRLYWSLSIYLVMIILFVPDIRPESVPTAQKTGEPEENPKKKAKEKLGIPYWLTLLNYFLVSISFTIFSLYLSMYVSENSLGNETTTGVINTISQLFGIIFGVTYGWFIKKFTGSGIIFYHILTAASFILLWQFPSHATVFGGFGLITGSVTAVVSYTRSVCPQIVPPERRGDAIAYITMSAGIATFLVAYLVTAVMHITNARTFTQTLWLPVLISFSVIGIQLLSGRLRSQQAKTSVKI